MYSKTIRIGFASLALLLLAMPSIANAQAYFYLWDNGGGNNNWGNGTNWGLNPPLFTGINNVTPNAFYEEMGLINNGNVVNVTTSQTQFNGAGADNVVGAAGANIDGVTTPTGNGSRLNIASGGSLTIYITYGPNGAPQSTTPTAGTGNVNLLNGGLLTVQPGGTLTVKNNIVITNGSMTVGGVAAGGTIVANELRELRATGAAAVSNAAVTLLGSANVTLTGGAVLHGTTTITGPSVVFKTPSISMNDSTVFSPDVTSNAVAAGTGHSVIDVTGSVSVNGTIRPQFHNGAVPHLGDVWTLWDAAQINGTFTASDATGPGATLLTGLRYALTTTTVGSVRGVKGQLTVENFLTAEVNRANGEVRIRNTNTTTGTGVAITGYQIGSNGGALDSAAFAGPFGGAWENANITDNSVGQLNPSGTSLIGLNANHSLGNIYDPVQLETTFGTTPVSDLTFSYSRSDGRTVNAPVTYINNNSGLANTFVLQVDPTDGKARIINDSIHDDVQFDGYHVTSASNSLLTTWNSLDDQSVPGWEETPSTTGSLAELNPLMTTTVDAGQSGGTMTGLFKTAGSMQDLVFQFRASAPVTTDAIGDYNEDGTVNAADYTRWRNMLGQAVALPNEDPTQTPNSVTQEDYNVWKANFGNTGGTTMGPFQVYTGVVRYVPFALGGGAIASSVPEPSTVMLLGFAGLATLTTCRRRK